jgi:hypothetical protein
MRSLALLGSFLLVTGVQAQSLAEHAAAASGATIGTAAGKPLSNAITKIFGQTDASAKKAANAPVVKSPDKPEREYVAPVQLAPQSGGGELPTLGGGSAPARHGGFSQHRSAGEYAAITPTAAVSTYIPEPVRAEPTAEEFATIQVGANEQDVISKLGKPESKVTIPDDDGHLLEICQYWSKGKQLGTVRLDNGQVVNVESRTQE